jgi:hypothetical protein
MQVMEHSHHRVLDADSGILVPFHAWQLPDSPFSDSPLLPVNAFAPHSRLPTFFSILSLGRGQRFATQTAPWPKTVVEIGQRIVYV